MPDLTTVSQYDKFCILEKKKSGQNLPSESNRETPLLTRGSSNYKAHHAAPTQFKKGILTSPVLQNLIHFYCQREVWLESHKF